MNEKNVEKKTNARCFDVFLGLTKKKITRKAVFGEVFQQEISTRPMPLGSISCCLVEPHPRFATEHRTSW